MKREPVQPEVLEGAPLRYAPANELGVVFLFAHLAARWHLRIDAIQSAFPDCIASQKTHGGERKIRIEFEFRSKNFRAHGHDDRQCDWIVCWEHDWPDAPNDLHVVELRREFGLGFNVWIVPLRPEYKDKLRRVHAYGTWSVPSQSHTGDLVLFYCTSPECCISEIFTLIERAAKVNAGWKKGLDHMAPVKRVCRLKAPVFLDDLRRHRVLSTAHFVRGQMQGRPNAMEYWPYLYEIIVRRNPSVRSKLKRYAPDQLG